MHEIVKYFIFTEIQEQCLNPIPEPLIGPGRPAELLCARGRPRRPADDGPCVGHAARRDGSRLKSRAAPPIWLKSTQVSENAINQPEMILITILSH